MKNVICKIKGHKWYFINKAKFPYHKKCKRCGKIIMELSDDECENTYNELGLIQDENKN